MGSVRTSVDDFGLRLYLAGHVTEAEARRAKDECAALFDGFEGGFCIVVDRRHLEAIEDEAMDIFESLIREHTPGRLKRLAVVYEGRLLGPHIDPQKLPRRVREALCFIDAAHARDWNTQAMQWVRIGDTPNTPAPEENS